MNETKVSNRGLTMERSKALEATYVLYKLENAESFLDEVVSAKTLTSDISDEMYDALKCFAKDWVEKYKKQLEDL